MTTRRITDVVLEDTTGAKQIIQATNWATNPRAALATTGFSAATTAGTGGTWDAGTANPTGGPLADAPSYFEKTIATVPSAGTMQIVVNGSANPIDNPADLGTFTLSIYAWASKAVTGVSVDLSWYQNTTSLVLVPGATVNIAANTWVKLPVVTSTASGATNRCQPRVNFPVAGVSGGVAIGDKFRVSALLITKPITGISAIDYLDGDVDGGSWVGAAHASRSRRIMGIL